MTFWGWWGVFQVAALITGKLGAVAWSQLLVQPFYKLLVLSLQKHFALLDIHSLKLVAVGQQLVV